jgi:hypothetical protein
MKNLQEKDKAAKTTEIQTKQDKVLQDAALKETEARSGEYIMQRTSTSSTPRETNIPFSQLTATEQARLGASARTALPGSLVLKR